ncbi:MAG: tail protein X [Planctomycetes bacterium]|nr:tail protein X [Planctomycetota bacterium]
MGQLEKYGLYVLVVVIVMILGIAMMGSPGDAAGDGGAPRSELAVLGGQDAPANGGTGDSANRFGGLFTPPEGGSGVPGNIEFVDLGGGGGPVVEKGDAERPLVPPPGPGDDSKRGAPIVDPAPTVRRHRIAAGETLSSISARYYGTSRHHQTILDANPGLDARRMPLHKEIVIPPLPVAKAADDPAVISSGSGNGDENRTREEPQPVPGPGVSRSVRRHRVAAGETLSSIAIRYYGEERHWPRILDANPGLDPNRMKANSELEIPVLATSTAVPRPSPRTAPAGGVLHRIAEGETLSSIARRYYGRENDWQRIVDANPGIDTKRLAIGTEIVVPEVVRPKV